MEKVFLFLEEINLEEEVQMLIKIFEKSLIDLGIIDNENFDQKLEIFQNQKNLKNQ